MSGVGHSCHTFCRLTTTSGAISPLASDRSPPTGAVFTILRWLTDGATRRHLLEGPLANYAIYTSTTMWTSNNATPACSVHITFSTPAQTHGGYAPSGQLGVPVGPPPYGALGGTQQVRTGTFRSAGDWERHCIVQSDGSVRCNPIPGSDYVGATYYTSGQGSVHRVMGDDPPIGSGMRTDPPPPPPPVGQVASVGGSVGGFESSSRL